jgi:hypothetical protein
MVLTEKEQDVIVQALEKIQDADALKEAQQREIDFEEHLQEEQTRKEKVLFALQKPEEDHQDIFGESDDDDEEKLTPKEPKAPKGKKVETKAKETKGKKVETKAKETKGKKVEPKAKETKGKKIVAKSKQTELVPQVLAPKEEELEEELEEEEEEEEPLKVEKFQYEGVDYLRNKNGLEVFTMSQEEIGFWDESTESIVLLEG